MTRNSVTVVWKQTPAARCGVTIWTLTDAARIVTGADDTTCVVTLSGLRRGIQYAYRPLADGVAIAGESSFKLGDPAQPFTFLVVGDSGTDGAQQMDVRDRMLSTPADFIVHTGDMIYERGAAADFDPKFFEPYVKLVRRLVFWPCLGNHDWRTSNGQPWRDAFYTPANNDADNENYYSFDYAAAHVAVLNSNGNISPGSNQYRFLDEDLAASTAPWKFVAFHHPIYSSGEHGSDVDLRDTLVPLFDEHGVDIVFMGHDHVYERTKPMRADEPVGPNAGTVYVVTGGGGRTLHDVGRKRFTAFSESTPHFVRVAVTGDRLLLQMIRDDGVVRDAMTIAKNTGALTPSLETVALEPSADTYIEAGVEGTWDHGGSNHLDVDTAPKGITYLKFDLSRLDGRIVSATLELHATNSSPDGCDVYSIATSSWVEGSGNGIDASSAGRSGLKWTDVDRNGDGDLDASDGSPLVPIATRRVASIGAITSGSDVAVDVTAAVQGPPGIYTLALRNTVRDGATYTSRNASRNRPVLRVTLDAER
jgi:hypothetical protein